MENSADTKEESSEEWTEATTDISLCDDGAVVEALLIIEIERAVGLPAMDVMTQRADPYCIIKFGTRVLRTTIKRRTRKPQWNEEFRILVSATELNYDLIIEVWDWDLISNNIIGKCSLCIAPLLSLESNPLHPFALPIHRSEPRIKRVTYQKDGGILYLNAGLVPRAEAEQLFWDKFLNLGPIFEGVKSPKQPRKRKFTKKNKKYVPPSPEEETCDIMNVKELSDEFIPNPLLIWQVYISFSRGDDLATLIKNSPQKTIISKHSEDKTLKKEILIYVRETGKLEVELVQPAIKRVLKLLYANKTGRAVTVNKRLRAFLNRMTIKKGIEYENPNSVKYIQPFIDRYNIDMSQFENPVQGWKHFNDFFYRSLLPGVRPIYEEKNPFYCVSPADCRMLVFPSISQATDVWIKGENFNLTSLLESEELASHYEGGSLVIARLAPQDYHRFHSPINCTVGNFVEVPGFYHTVNPIAVNHPIDIFTTNRRLYTLLHSGEFGMVCYIAIGATMVGSIQFTAQPGDIVQKGDEMGYFAFGGSTLLLLFEPGEIEFDKDLLCNSEKPLETLVKMGERIGIAFSQLI